MNFILLVVQFSDINSSLTDDDIDIQQKTASRRNTRKIVSLPIEETLVKTPKSKAKPNKAKTNEEKIKNYLPENGAFRKVVSDLEAKYKPTLINANTRNVIYSFGHYTNVNVHK